MFDAKYIFTQKMKMRTDRIFSSQLQNPHFIFTTFHNITSGSNDTIKVNVAKNEVNDFPKRRNTS